MVTARYKEAEKKAKEHLDKKYSKLETKWNDYVSDVNRDGVTPKVFCNTTCSHK